MPDRDDEMANPQPPQDIRPSPIAGKWYPGDPKHLADTIDEFIASAEVPTLDGRLVGVLAPHAGHRYSGPVAGYAFKLLKGLEVDVVALVAVPLPVIPR
jgi:AmmeMemoRadiSam system protein B